MFFELETSYAVNELNRHYEEIFEIDDEVNLKSI